MIRAAAGSLLVSAALLATAFTSRRAPETIQPNDHTKSAGKLAGGVLDIALETRLGR